jgi:hypothetical protein
VSIRFLADADLNQAIVTGALDREPALDFLTATEADLHGQDDPEVLELAAAQGRVLVSHDTSTMPVHFFDRLRSGRRSPGVFLVRQRASVGQVVDAILLVWSASAPEEWAGQIHYLPSFARHDFHH